MSAQWKQLERTVAAAFGVARRVRGDDFSRQDVEVISHWAPDHTKFKASVAECKYRVDVPIPSRLQVITPAARKQGKEPCIIWGDEFAICWLNSRGNLDGVGDNTTFAAVHHYLTNLNFARRSGAGAIGMLKHLFIKQEDRKIPGYVHEFMAQAEDYGHLVDEYLRSLQNPIVESASRDERDTFFCVCMKEPKRAGVAVLFKL